MEAKTRRHRPSRERSRLMFLSHGLRYGQPSMWSLYLTLCMAVVFGGCAEIIGAPFDKEFVVAQATPDGGAMANGIAASCIERGAECGAFQDDVLLVTFYCGGCASNAQCLDNQCVCNTVTCEDLGVECGYQNNGCNQLINCGRCEALYPGDPKKAYCGTEGTCGEAPVLPSTCEEVRALGLAADCGTVGVGERTLDCGSCLGREQCINNRCEGYTPLTCEELTGGGLLCGTFPNGAGDEITCACGPEERCSQGNICCTPRTECSEESCGTMPDGCGGTIDCGGCGDGETCQGNVCCGGTPECPPGACGSQVEVCGQLLNCGCASGQCCLGDEDGSGVCHTPSCPTDGRCGDALPDGCGGTVDGCGCPSEHECGSSNMCECVPRSCPTDGTCGLVDDGCGGVLECFVCPAGELCNEGQCCLPSCPSDGACGLVSNGCGGQIMCGCAEGEACVEKQCVTPECPAGAECGVNLVNGLALSCRGQCEEGDMCAERADGIYACGDCSAECPTGGSCGLLDLGCTSLSCAGDCALPGQFCVNHQSGEGPDNFSCCTPSCPNVNEATCGDNVDPFCGGNVANCPGICPSGQRCVLNDEGDYGCVTPQCPSNPVCGQNQALPEGTIQCRGSCSGANEQCVQTGAVFECVCQVITDPCGDSCGSSASNGCGGQVSCSCPASEECVQGACCKPDTARAVCDAAEAECGVVVDPKCGLDANCGLCGADQTCDDLQCVCDPSKCEAHESCDAASETCKCDSSKCPDGQACTNAGVCSCDSSQCPSGKTCNSQGMCACPQSNTSACAGNTCGTALNSCGDTVTCGTCSGSRTCEAGQCVCNESDEDACEGIECGSTQNACGESINCGACGTNEMCSGGQCVCNESATAACARLEYECGPALNICGDSITCPTPCGADQTCSGNQCVCTATPEQACATFECGEVVHPCLGMVMCPNGCTTNETCVNHECVCQESAAAACLRLELECGAPPAEATNLCGETLPLGTTCGTCAGTETCQNNQCTCVETACQNRVCGMVTSSCTGMDISCGTCSSGTCSDAGVCTPPATDSGP